MSEQFHGEEEKNITEKLMLKLTIKLEKKKTDCKRKSSDAEDSFENTATTYILMQS